MDEMQIKHNKKTNIITSLFIVIIIITLFFAYFHGIITLSKNPENKILTELEKEYQPAPPSEQIKNTEKAIENLPALVIPDSDEAVISIVSGNEDMDLLADIQFTPAEEPELHVEEKNKLENIEKANLQRWNNIRRMLMTKTVIHRFVILEFEKDYFFP